ncbi:hypothetical protein FQN54_009679 [Arachnomyces sp. PD_36]|nr:hypothetical protein FQN54_009679 [Arachnomyces sp. PD_36]
MSIYSPSPSAKGLSLSSSIRIAELSPSLENPKQRYVCAVVTLLWPFSSSTRSFSLLLSDPDFRLRRLNGQVKATFHGSSAEAVAHSKVGIGDTVILGLDGVQWVNHEAGDATPGKGINWDLNFNDRVVLEVHRDSQHFHTVEHDTPRPVDPPPEDVSASSFSSGFNSGDTERISPPPAPNQWSSPAFSRLSRQSLGSLSIPSYDPFAEEDGYVAGKGRKRTRFSLLSSEWRFSDTSPSPTKMTTSDPFEDVDMEDLDLESRRSRSPQSDGSGIEPVPKLIPDGLPDGGVEDETESIPNATETESFQNATGREDTPGIDIIDGQGVSYPEIVVQSEEQDGFIVQAHSNNEALGTSTWQLGLDNNISAGEQAGTVPYPAINEMVPSVVVENTSTTELVVTGMPETHAADTPRLRPIDSAGLPLVSPLHTRSGTPVGQFNEPEHPPEGHTTEEDTFIESQDAQMVDVGLQKRGKPSSQQSTESSDSFGVELQTTPSKYIFPRDGEDVESEASDEDQVSEEEVEYPVLPEAHSTSYPDETGSVGFQEQQLEQPQAVSEDYPYSVESEDEDESVSPGGEDRHVEIDEEVPGPIDEAESGSSPEDYNEYPEEYYGEAESDEERVGSDEDMWESEDEPQADGEYELDDAAAPSASHEQQPVTMTQHEVIVLDSDDEAPPATDNENVRPGEVESPFSDEEESVVSEEENDIESTGLPEDMELSQPYMPESGDMMADDKELQPEEGVEYPADMNEGQFDEQSQTSDVAEPETNLENEPSSEPEESAHEIFYGHSPSFSPTSRSEDEPESGYVDEQVYNSGLFSTQNRDISPPPPREKKSPSGLSLDGPSSPQQVGRRPNPLLSVRSPSFRKNLPPSPVASQERSPSPSQQLLFGLGIQPTFPTPDASQDAAAVRTQEYSEATERRELDGSNIENRINIFEASHLQNSTEGVKTHIEVQSYSEKETQHVAESEEVAEAPSESEFPSADKGEAELQDGHHDLGHQTTTKSPAPEESEFDVSASQPDASTSPETTLVPEISDEARKSEERPIHNGDQNGVGRDEPQTPKDKSFDPTFLTPYPVKVPKPEPDRHATGLRTPLSYYAPLSTLVDNFNTTTDTLSIVISATQPLRATSGARDYHTTIHVTDRSLGGRTTSAQIFRRYKRAIPRPCEGDVILLRNFKVTAFNHTMMLQSVTSSSWAVFDQGKPDAMKATGPPVEVGDEEKNYVTELRKLYTDGVVAVSDRGSIPTSRASTAFSTASSESGATESRTPGGGTPRGSRRKKPSRNRRVTIHELRHGRRYTDVGSGSDKESIHELRDGTVYVNP